MWYIYKTTNLVNGKFYIGKHSPKKGVVDMEYLGSGKLLWNAINKYGKENFVQEIIEFTNSEEENCEREIYWIEKLDARNRQIAYNIAKGGKQRPFSSETNKKLCLRQWQNMTPEQRKERIDKMIAGVRRPEVRLDIGEKAKKWHESKTEQQHEAWKQKLSKPKCSNENYKGERNSMYGRSVKDIWIEKHGLEKAEEMWKEYRQKLQNSSPAYVGTAPNVKLQQQSPYWKEYQKSKAILQGIKVRYKRGKMKEHEYNDQLENAIRIKDELKELVNLTKGDKND
jgi:group I intron endonuclease